MKKLMFAGLSLLALTLSVPQTFAAEQTEVTTQMKEVVAKIQAKVKEGKKSEADLAPELKALDAIVAGHKGEKTDEIASVLNMEAMIYMSVLNNTEKATKIIEQIKSDYPETMVGKNADKMLASMKSAEEAKKIQKTLAEGTKFPEFDEKDVNGKPLSIAGYRGKVVLVDFWATWCPPCRAELPNVVKTYEKHHPEGFEIIGVSLDKEQDKEKLLTYTKENKMPWQQFFDGKMWQNKLAVKYGINSIPMTYLLDGDGKIIGKGLRGEALESAVAKALTKT